MKRRAGVLLLAVLLAVLGARSDPASAARQSVPEPELDAVASTIAGQPVTVRCWTEDGSDVDAQPDAWAYVYPEDPVVYLGPLPCAGARALAQDSFAPAWELGLGALSLTHEAYHLKVALAYWRRVDEAQTECRAVKRVYQTMLDLGTRPDLASEALPWAVAEHFKIETLGDGSYNYPSCRVPVFDSFWP